MPTKGSGPNLKKTFTALIQRDGTALNRVIARVPFDFLKQWPQQNRRRVRGDIQGFPFRTTLFSEPQPGALFLIVNRKMQAGAGVSAGQIARITLQPDVDARDVLIPAELSREFKADRQLNRWFTNLSPSMRREIATWVGEPKSAESRHSRAVKMAERLCQAMEGEHDPPPVLKAAFQRQPQARAGWAALTPIQRRNHLLGIFYYETADARRRRAAKAVEDALRAARKKTNGTTHPAGDLSIPL